MGIRGGITQNADVQSVTLTAVVYNADGTVKKNLGEVAYHDKSKWKMFVWYVKHPKQLVHRVKVIWRSICPEKITTASS
jgi:hypothetical protein